MEKKIDVPYDLFKKLILGGQELCSSLHAELDERYSLRGEQPLQARRYQAEIKPILEWLDNAEALADHWKEEIGMDEK